jgi:AraC family transcriptional regulator
VHLSNFDTAGVFMETQQPLPDGQPLLSTGHGLPAPLLSSRARGWNDIVVELLCASNLDVDAPCPEHVIMVILAGRATLWQTRDRSGAQCAVRPGDAIFLSAGEAKRWQHVDEIVAVILRLSRAYLDKLAAELDASAREGCELRDVLSVRDPFLQETAMCFLKAFEPDSPCAAHIEARVRSLGQHLLTRYASKREHSVTRLPSMPPKKLRRAVEFIEANLHRDLSVTDIARHLSMSESHFSHLFRQTVGVPPQRYVRDRRVERAKSLLRHSDLPMTEIAQSVGCSSCSHFSVLFHRTTGLTPRRYRALD